MNTKNDSKIKFECPKCGTVHRIDTSKAIKSGIKSGKCRKCSTKIFIPTLNSFSQNLTDKKAKSIQKESQREMISTNKSPEDIEFNTIRQFTVMPDRHYRVRLRNKCLYFEKIGSQFDRSWLNKGLENGVASKVLPQWIKTKLIRLAGGSKRKLLWTGITLELLSLLILIILPWGSISSVNSAVRYRSWRHMLLLFPILIMLLVTGIVFIIVGLCSEGLTEESEAEDSSEFYLPQSSIVKARLEKGGVGMQGRLRAGGGQVARLDIVTFKGKQLRLALPTDFDLETVERHIVPLLGKRMHK